MNQLSDPEIDQSIFNKHDWSKFYQNFKEAIPMNAPEPRAKEVDIHMFLDSNHSGNKVSQRLRINFFI